MNGKSLVMVFIRNPEIGKVKTRLAKTIGDTKAFKVYLHLLNHTLSCVSPLKTDKSIFYSDYIPKQDEWQLNGFYAHLQSGGDLGKKMLTAFEISFKKGYQNILILGSDCLELTSSIIQNALEKLEKTDVVIGPAKDGGYYLLGMNTLYTPLFENKNWSTNSVFKDTIKEIENLKLNYIVLEELSDIDEEADLPKNFEF